MYNNFRAHNSSHGRPSAISSFPWSISLQKLYEGKVDSAEFKKAFYWSTRLSAGLCLFFALLGPGFFDFTAPGDDRYGQAAGALVSDRKDLMRSDSFRSFLIIAITAGLVWAYYNKK
ncbi:MAG: hypothetical protein R2769_05350 [Saprospiraceae bacterium]